MDEQVSCQTSMTIKKEGPEPFRCTLPDDHIERTHPLVQAGSGKTWTIHDPAWCCGGRVAFFYTRSA